ncbi:50S ribosomal protein L21 [Ureaplasma ceti]|uniref:Large ribosomal subunit protein bL21 n=1 Tax=Ureaplasma ceti TaxID=3119530 RepID=A0ABP9U8C3_9BACT
MFAVFQTGGKQYKVQQGDVIFVEKLNVAEGQDITFDQVLMTEKGIGKPFVAGASVVATVEKHGKQKKIDIVKFQSKKHHYKRQGHRQPYTKLVIKSINA